MYLLSLPEQVIAIVSDSRKIMSRQMPKAWMIAAAQVHINSSVTV